MQLLTTTKPGEKYRSIKNPAVYEALRRRGYSKRQAARISNAQKRHKAFSIDTLEAYVSGPHYDADLAGLIALRIPALKALPEAPAAKPERGGKGQPGEHIAQGITRIRGNLCNVHGRYGPCDKALSGKKKPGKGRAARKPVKTDQQRATERDQKRQANIDSVAQRMADTDTGLSPSGSKALTAFAKGQQPTAQEGAGLASLGLAERASDGSYRMTPTGRAVVAAMAAGDYQRAVDGISRGTDAAGKRNERTTAAQARREAAQGKRAPRGAAGLAQGQLGGGSRSPLDALAQGQVSGKKPAKRTPRKASSAGGDKKPDDSKAPRAYESPRKAGGSRSSAPSVGGVAGAAGNKKPVVEPKPEKAPAKQIDPQLAEAATALSEGKEVSDEQIMALVRNGLVKLNKDGVPVLTAAGQRATMKSYDGTLTVFKDITGAWRWIAQSSTAFQDRDREIVSTKALSDDCERADADGGYGPLRWWHTPGLDLGDCDFNAMHGRVLIESGTFRSAVIAQKIARSAGDLEISLGFLHLPTEPDADGVFHHIRRFERSLVPRGKASNRFTAFTVKESPVDTKKIEGLKAYGFSDADIADLLATAAATEKTADDQGVAYKAEEPSELPDVVINGVTYKAMPPIVEEDKAEPVVVETDAVEDMPMDDEPDDPNALTLSQGDLAAIGELINGMASQIMGGLDLEKKVAGHVQGLLAPFQQAQATKETALTTQVAELKQQVDDLTGAQPAAPYRASQAKNNTIMTDVELAAAVKSAQEPGSGPWDDIIKGLGLGQPQ